MNSEANFYLEEAKSCRQKANRYLYGATVKLIGLGGVTFIAHEAAEKVLPERVASKILKVGLAATALTTFTEVASSAQERVEAFINEQKAKILVEAESFVHETEYPQTA